VSVSVQPLHIGSALQSPMQFMQVSSTFRSLTRNKLPIENTAPLGQTYLHQNRGRKKPSPSLGP
jgi:hypothetical protein